MNCKCEQDEEGAVTSLCGAHSEHVRRVVNNVAEKKELDITMLTQEIQYLKARLWDEVGSKRC